MTNRVGQQLGNYRLVRLLGEGGFAEVYLGEHIHLGTQAAIKVLHTQLTSDDMETFRLEARRVAHLEHPHIVRVLDFGVEGRIPFLVMDYAANGTLRHRHLKGTRLTLATIVSYAKQVADALQYAHDEKLIHRDVKPENMLVGRHQEILLSDFGIAVMAQSSRYQNAQDMAGTITYMAPEQIQGKPRPASDQYSLGIIIYEWLTGKRPFHGSLTEMVGQHLSAAPPPLRETLPTISSAVEEVVMRALAKDPKQRFASVKVFANALEQASQEKSSTVVRLHQNSPHVPSSPSQLTVQAAQLSASASLQPPLHASPQPLVTPPIPVMPPASASQVRIPPSMAKRSKPAQAKLAAKPPSKKADVWNIDKRRIVAMLLGLALCVVSMFILKGYLYFIIRFFASFQTSIAHDAIVIVLLALIEVFPLFFGSVFGPWVGLFIAGVGSFIGGYIFFDSTFNYYISAYFNSGLLVVNLVIALIGFAAGLATLKTQGHYPNFRTIAVAEGFSSLGVITAFSFVALSQILPVDQTVRFAIVPFLTLPGLIVLPILLVIYRKIANS